MDHQTHRVGIIEVGPGNEAAGVDEPAWIPRVIVQRFTQVNFWVTLCLGELHIAAAAYIPVWVKTEKEDQAVKGGVGHPGTCLQHSLRASVV
eukprot:1156395-Pelagomonas_calceolata.AAC.7